MSSHIPYTPVLPSDEALHQSRLPDKSLALSLAAARLAGQVAPQTRHTIIRHMAVINSYYSNLIEGNKTRPHEIRAAQQGRLLKDPARRDLQLESLAHIKVQQWIAEQNLSLDTLFGPGFIRAIHHEFYRYVPETLYELKNAQGGVLGRVVPGQWRTQEIGRASCRERG